MTACCGVIVGESAFTFEAKSATNGIFVPYIFLLEITTGAIALKTGMPFQDCCK